MNVSLIRDVIRLNGEKQTLQNQLKAVQASLDAAKAAVTEEFRQEGVSSARIDKMTVYLRHQLSKRLGEDRTYPDFAFWLQSRDMGFLTTVSHSSFDKHVRELADEGMSIADIEQFFDGWVAVSESYDIGIRGSA